MEKVIFNIVSTNNAALLGECLNSVIDNISLKNYEIWVVDNNSHDETQQMLKNSFPQVNVIRNDKRCPNFYNRNLIFNKARGDYYMFMSEDIKLMPNAVEALLEKLVRHKDIGIIGCKALNPDGSVQNSCYVNYPNLLTEIGRLTWFPRLLKKFFPYKEYPWDLWPSIKVYETEREMATINGCCFLLRKAVLDSVGLLDGGYKHYYGDIDFMYRARRNGWRIYYIPDVSVIHKWGGYSGKMDFIDRFSVSQYDMYRFFLKFYGKRNVCLLWIAKAILSFCMLIPVAILSFFKILPDDSDKRHFLQEFFSSFYWHIVNLKDFSKIMKNK